MFHMFIVAHSVDAKAGWELLWELPKNITKERKRLNVISPHHPTPCKNYHEQKHKRRQHLSNTKNVKFLSAAIDGARMMHNRQILYMNESVLLMIYPLIPYSCHSHRK